MLFATVVMVSFTVVVKVVRVLFVVIIVGTLGVLDLLFRIGVPIAGVVAVAFLFAGMTMLAITMVATWLVRKIAVFTVVGGPMILVIDLGAVPTMLRMVC